MNPKSNETKESRVKSPNHYTKGIQPWDYIASNNMNYFAGNVVKYLTRYKYKNGMEDLLKAKEYIDKLIAIQKEGEELV
jgi:hypothetical protein